MEYKHFIRLYLTELSNAKTSGRTVKARPADTKRTEQRQNYYVSIQVDR